MSFAAVDDWERARAMRAEFEVCGSISACLMRIRSRPQLVPQRWAPRLFFPMFYMTSQPGPLRKRIVPRTAITITVSSRSKIYGGYHGDEACLFDAQSLRASAGDDAGLQLPVQRLIWSVIDSLLLPDERSLGILVTSATHLGTRLPRSHRTTPCCPHRTSE